MLDGYHQLSKELQNMLGERGGRRERGGGEREGEERERGRGEGRGEGRREGEGGEVGGMEVEVEVKSEKSIHHSYSYKLNKHTLQT